MTMTKPPPMLNQKDWEFAARTVTDWVHGDGRSTSGNIETRRTSARNAHQFINGQDYFQTLANYDYEQNQQSCIPMIKKMRLP